MSRCMKIIFVLTLISALFFAFTAMASEKKPDKKAILIASFGTSMPDAKKGIDSLVNAAKKAFPGVEVRLAYTSNIIRRKIAKEQKVIMPTPSEALAALNDEGYTHVYVMPTHIIPGEEFDGIRSIAEGFAVMEGKYGFKKIAVGETFLHDIPNTERFADLLIKRYAKELADKSTGVVLMGHGTPTHIANALYTQLQFFLDRKAPGRFFIGTVEVAPVIDDVIGALKHSKKEKVVLSPLMIVAGDHANNDMADAEDPESWVSLLKQAGFKNIDVRIEGLGEDPRVAEVFVEHIKNMMK